MALLPAILSILMEAPDLLNDVKALWAGFAIFHNAGAITLTSDQIAQMNAEGVTLDMDIASLRAAAGPKPAAVAVGTTAAVPKAAAPAV